MTVYRVWRTNPTAATCAVCDGLNGTRVRDGQDFPLGLEPPAHPHCGCEVITEDDSQPYASYSVTTEQNNPDYESYEITKGDSMTRTYRTDAAGRDHEHVDGCSCTGALHHDARTARASKSKGPRLAPPVDVAELWHIAKKISSAMERRDYQSLPILTAHQHSCLVDLLGLSPEERKRQARDLASDVFVAERFLQKYGKEAKQDMAQSKIKIPTRDDEAAALAKMESDVHAQWQRQVLAPLHTDDEHDDEDLTPEQRARAAMDRAAAARNAGKSHVHRRDR